MSKYYIRFSLLKTCVRGKNEETYSLLMEENDLTIIFHPLTKVGEVFEDMYKSVSDVIKEVQDFDEH